MFKFIILFFCSFYVSSSLACKCAVRNDSEVYCSSDFVAHVVFEGAKFYNETSGKSKYVAQEYKVDFTKVFRKDKRFADIEKSKKIFSNYGCGVELNISSDAKKNNYLVAGYVAKGKGYIHLCGWMKNWNDVSDSLKKSLEKNEFDGECPEKMIQKENEKVRLWRKNLKSNYTDSEEARNHTQRKPPKNFLTRLLF